MEYIHESPAWRACIIAAIHAKPTSLTALRSHAPNHRLRDPEYMRTGEYSARSDVYALGMVLLQLLTGREGAQVGRSGAPPGDG